LRLRGLFSVACTPDHSHWAPDFKGSISENIPSKGVRSAFFGFSGGFGDFSAETGIENSNTAEHLAAQVGLDRHQWDHCAPEAGNYRQTLGKELMSE